MKATLSSLFLVILLSTLNCYANASDSPLLCLPGSSFQYDHNKCFCSYDGTKMTCKRKILTTLTPELHWVQLQNITTSCLPGTYFKESCQKCLCQPSGKYATCMRDDYCLNDIAIRLTDTRDNCTPGSVFYDDCNGCICGSDGTAACTNLRCSFERSKGPVDDTTRCVPNSYFVSECNDCMCNKNGTNMLCTKMGCSPLTFYHDGLLNVTMKCQANKIFNYNCHQCICDKTGAFAMCSGKECPHEYDMVEVKDTPGNCNPGMIFADDCNVCICGKYRRGACTTFSCDTPYNFIYVDHLNFSRPKSLP